MARSVHGAAHPFGPAAIRVTRAPRFLAFLSCTLTTWGGSAAVAQPAANVWQPIGPTLATVLTLNRDPVQDTVVYAGTNFGGLYRSTDNGFSWSHIQSQFSGDVVFGVAIAPTQPRRLLVGTLNGGVYRSVDGGETWAPVNEGLGVLAVRDVAYDPGNPMLALAATSTGIFRSIDGGETWSLTLSGGGVLSVQHLLFDAANAGMAYAGTLGSGIHRSTDGGATWQPFTTGIGARDIVSLSWDANSPSLLWAATPSGVFSRAPGEAAWTSRTLNLPESAQVRSVGTVRGHSEVLASTFEGVFALASQPLNTGSTPAWRLWHRGDARLTSADRSGAAVLVVHTINLVEATRDFGMTFAPAVRGMQNLFCGALEAKDVNGVTRVYAGTGNQIRVTPGEPAPGAGYKWSALVDVGGAVFDLASSQQRPSRMFAGTEGFGVLRSTDFGAHWAGASRGMVPARILDIEQSRAPAGTFYAGTDSGFFVSHTGGHSWEQRAQDQNPVPITDVKADPVYFGWVYYATADGRFFRSQDDGEHFFHLWSSPPGDAIRQIDRSPFFEIYAVLNSGALYASTDDGENFFPRAQGQISQRILCVAANERRPWIVYVGTEFGGVYRSGTSGTDWKHRSQGLTAPVVYSLAVSPHNDQFIVAGARGAVYLSADEAATWTRSGSGLPPQGLVASLLFDPNNADRLYARVVQEPVESPAQPGGEVIYCSVDRGHKWRALTNAPTSSQASALCISRTAPNTLLAGADHRGISLSSNGGVSWQDASDGLTLIVLSVAIDPHDPDTMYAATFSGGVFKSSDGGGTWAAVGPEGVTVFHVTVNPSMHSTIYAGTSQGVMRSDDGGAAWRLAGQDTPFIITIASDATQPGRLYAGSYAGTAYRSDDGGGTWLDISRGLPRDDVNAIVVSTLDGTVYAGTATLGVYRSHDGGASWWPANPAAMAGYRLLDLAIDPANDAIYAGIWGGGLKSTDHGDTWTALPLGFGRDYPTAIAVAPLAGSFSAVFISVQNEQGQGIPPGAPVIRSLDGGVTWTALSDGIDGTDALTVATSSGPMPRVYLGATGGVYRSDDLGQTWEWVSAGLEGLTVFSLAVDASDHNHAFAATSGGLFTTVSGGFHWTPVAFDAEGLGAQPWRLALAKDGGVYVGTTERGVFFSADDGLTWGGGVTPQTALMVPQAIAVHPNDPSVVWAATGDQGVAVSRDRGQTWSLSNRGLGARVMFTITIDATAPDTIYATSQDAGIWMSQNAGADWSALNDGLWNPFVTSFAIDPHDRHILYAGTEGGGVFRLRRP